MAWLDWRSSRKDPVPEEPEEDFAQELEPIPQLLSYQVSNLQQRGARPYQEDSFAFVNALDVTDIRENGLLAVLADGMGGMEAGKQVSEMAVASVMAAFETMDRTDDLAKQLQASVEETDRTLERQFGGYGGTTIIACILYEEKLYFTSVGDSYLYLKREDSLYRLNREQNYRHQLYMEAIRGGRLDPAAADADGDGSRLSTFLGMGGLADIDTLRRPFPLQDGDTLLICSDGVGGVLTEEEVLQCLRCQDASENCERLDAAVQAQRRKHQDNYTALVIRCEY